MTNSRERKLHHLNDWQFPATLGLVSRFQLSGSLGYESFTSCCRGVANPALGVWSHASRNFTAVVDFWIFKH